MYMLVYIYRHRYVYIIHSLVQPTLTGRPGLRILRWPLDCQVGLQVGLVLPSWAAKRPLGVKLGRQGALSKTFWLQMGSNLASKCLPECPGPSILLDSMAL